jgi:hypothetical protein
MLTLEQSYPRFNSTQPWGKADNTSHHFGSQKVDPTEGGARSRFPSAAVPNSQKLLESSCDFFDYQPEL